MNPRIRRLSLLAAALLGTATLAAGAAPGPRQPPSFDELAQILVLRPEQMGAVRTAFEAEWARRAAARQDAETRRRSERRVFEQSLAGLLTAEQIQRLQVWRESRPKPGRGRRPAIAGAAP